jgi:hypothetical protein
MIRFCYSTLFPIARKAVQFRGQYAAIDKWHETDANSGAMVRIARGIVPDGPHHVVQRGVRRLDGSFPLMTDNNTSICKKGGRQKDKKGK